MTKDSLAFQSLNWFVNFRRAIVGNVEFWNKYSKF